MAIEIRKSVPLPAHGNTGRGSGGGGVPTFPFEAMQVGDSFETPNKRVPAAASAWRGRKPERQSIKFVTRRLPSGNVGVWRTA
jgi:hypothetical protein